MKSYRSNTSASRFCVMADLVHYRMIAITNEYAAELSAIGVPVSPSPDELYCFVPRWVLRFRVAERIETKILASLARASLNDRTLFDAAMSSLELGGVDSLVCFVTECLPEATPIALP